MKKVLVLVLIAILSCPYIRTFCDTPSRLTVYTNYEDNPKVLQNQILTSNNILMIEPKPILESYGFTCTYDAKSQTLNITKGNMKIAIQSGKTNALKNGTAFTLEAAPIILNNMLLVPVDSLLIISELDYFWEEKNISLRIFTDANSMLYNAVITDDTLRVEQCIKKGADPNYVSYMGYSMLEYAISSGSFNTVDYLISSGANINAKDSSGDPMLFLQSDMPGLILCSY